MFVAQRRHQPQPVISISDGWVYGREVIPRHRAQTKSSCMGAPMVATSRCWLWASNLSCGQAGGIPVGPVTDWATLVEEALPTTRITASLLLGGSPQDVPDRYRERFPLTYAEQVLAPILAIHGRNDPRTPADQMQRYVTRLRQLDKSIGVVWFEEGHHNGGREQMITQQACILEFTRQQANEQAIRELACVILGAPSAEPCTLLLFRQRGAL